jgi:hypothetical protein
MVCLPQQAWSGGGLASKFMAAIIVYELGHPITVVLCFFLLSWHALVLALWVGYSCDLLHVKPDVFIRGIIASKLGRELDLHRDSLIRVQRPQTHVVCLNHALLLA